MMAKRLQALNETVSNSTGIETVEVVIAEVLVGSAAAENMEYDEQNLMPSGDYRFPPPAPRLYPVKESPQITLLTVRSGPSRLGRHPS